MLNCKFTCKITLSLVPCQYHALVLVEVGQCSQGRTHQGFQICSRSTLPWQLASVQPSILDLQSINIAITDGFYKTIYFWSAANQHCHDSWLLCNITASMQPSIFDLQPINIAMTVGFYATSILCRHKQTILIFRTGMHGLVHEWRRISGVVIQAELKAVQRCLHHPAFHHQQPTRRKITSATVPYVPFNVLKTALSGLWICALPCRW